MKVKPVPEGFHTITPYIVVDDAKKLIEFAKKAFDAKENDVMKGPDGRIAHASLQIGDSRVMVGQASERAQTSPVQLYLYVKDADALFKKAISAGGTVVNELKDQFYGDRSGGVKDFAGNTWHISTHIEDVSPKEMQKRMEEAMSQMQN